MLRGETTIKVVKLGFFPGHEDDDNEKKDDMTMTA